MKSFSLSIFLLIIAAQIGNISNAVETIEKLDKATHSIVCDVEVIEDAKEPIENKNEEGLKVISTIKIANQLSNLPEVVNKQTSSKTSAIDIPPELI